jgi:hypothetical protein
MSSAATSARRSPAARPASRMESITPSSSARVWASAISPDSIIASSVPIMPCLVISHSPNRSIQRRIASAGGNRPSSSRPPTVSRSTWSWYTASTSDSRVGKCR